MDGTRRNAGRALLLAGATAALVGVLATARGRSPLPGAAGTLALPSLEGSRMRPPGGAIAIVDFWATWCAPCRISMPRLQGLWREYQGRGVAFYSVDTDDEGPSRRTAVQQFLAQNGLSHPVALDDGSAASAFQVVGLPTLVLLDREGRVAFRHVGMLTAANEGQLRNAIDAALEGQPGPRQP